MNTRRPQIRRAAGATLLAGAAALALAIVPAQADDDERELECEAGSDRTISLDVNDEEWREGRTWEREFDAEIDIERGRGHAEGDIAVFHVGNKRVARVPLQRERDGDLTAEVDFKSWRGVGPNAFPADFPAFKRGTVVKVSVDGKKLLSCKLR